LKALLCAPAMLRFHSTRSPLRGNSGRVRAIFARECRLPPPSALVGQLPRGEEDMPFPPSALKSGGSGKRAYSAGSSTSASGDREIRPCRPSKAAFRRPLRAVTATGRRAFNRDQKLVRSPR
jgi:hypothetical protein